MGQSAKNAEIPGATQLRRNNFDSKQVKVKVKVTLRLTVSLGVEPNLGLLTIEFFSQSYCLVFWWCALSDERSGLSRVSLCHCSLH
jgi:hypothetical protein